MKIIILILMITMSISANTRAYTLGGYSEFFLNTQSELTGGKNIFSYVPMIGVNSIIPTNLPLLGPVLFFPEFGFIFHTGTPSTYTKSQIYLLLDIGNTFAPGFVWRAGVGTFISKISGEGGGIILNNGGSSKTFYMPSKSSTSINTTFDLGVEYAFDANHALRVSSYVFSAWSSVKRSVSYSLSWSYYPN